MPSKVNTYYNKVKKQSKHKKQKTTDYGNIGEQDINPGGFRKKKSGI